MSGYPKIIHTEEGMRDRLQIESPDIPLAAKLAAPVRAAAR